MKIWNKSPAETLDYAVDLSRWLPEGDAITSAAADLEGGTATIQSVSAASDAVTVWVSGGAEGETAHVSVVATTVQGRTKEVCFSIRIRDCC